MARIPTTINDLIEYLIDLKCSAYIMTLSGVEAKWGKSDLRPHSGQVADILHKLRSNSNTSHLPPSTPLISIPGFTFNDDTGWPVSFDPKPQPPTPAPKTMTLVELRDYLLSPAVSTMPFHRLCEQLDIPPAFSGSSRGVLSRWIADQITSHLNLPDNSAKVKELEAELVRSKDALAKAKADHRTDLSILFDTLFPSSKSANFTTDSMRENIHSRLIRIRNFLAQMS